MSTKLEIFENLENEMTVSLQQAATEALTDTEKAIATIKSMQQSHNRQHQAADRDRLSATSSKIDEIKVRIAELFGKGKNQLLSYLLTRQDELDVKVTTLTAAVEVAEKQANAARETVGAATSKADAAQVAKAALDAIQAELADLNAIISDKKSNVDKQPFKQKKAGLLEANQSLQQDLRNAPHKVIQATETVNNARLKLNDATQSAESAKKDLADTARLLDSVKNEIARLSPAPTPTSNNEVTPTPTPTPTAAATTGQESSLAAVSPVPTENARESEQQRREQVLGRFTQSLKRLEAEVVSLRDDSLAENEASFFPCFNQDSAAAADAGRVLHDALLELKNRFVREKSMTVEQFKDACNPLINTALDSPLAKQPFWSEFLHNLLFVVANILTLGVASGISYMATGDARFFKVPEKEAAIIVNDLQTAVNVVSAP